VIFAHAIANVARRQERQGPTRDRHHVDVPGPSRHFAATQQFRRFRSEADIQRAALTELRPETAAQSCREATVCATCAPASWLLTVDREEPRAPHASKQLFPGSIPAAGALLSTS
jgi:hypothetical protein